jgi:glutamate-1-semialdehyde 2,1-aminomutase
MDTTKSQQAFDRACRYMPGGVNSPVRSFKSVGGVPRFLRQGKGSKVTDIDGNNYVDYVGSWGPLILGHAHPTVVAAVGKAAHYGLSFGASTEAETRLAELICQSFDSIEQVRLVNSGTEATASAIRLARAFTGRQKIVKAAGCYHGHVDQLLVEAGSGVATLGLPSSSGVPDEVARQTVVVPYNDLAAVEQAFSQFGDEIAAVLIEPIAGNMGVVPPAAGYLAGLREQCDKHKALLIFDEVITGFRVTFGGAQQLYGINADLTCLGKIIGGGMPVGAYGGRRDIMQMLAPLGPVYQAGTLSGNPIAVAAGLATIETLASPNSYETLETLAAALAQGLADAARESRIPVTINRIGSMMTMFFGPGPVRNFAEAKNADSERYRRYFHCMLDAGVYLPPSPFESLFVSLAHTQDDIRFTLDHAGKSFALLAGES